MLGDRHEANVEAAVDDIWARTLANLPCNLSRLVYLASTRDYNSLRYYHDGLAMRFSQEVANSALAQCHAQVFRELVYFGLRELTEDVREYLTCSQTRPETFLESWSVIEPFTVLIPLNSNPVTIRIFTSNFRVVLVILAQWQKTHVDLPNASPLLSPGG